MIKELTSILKVKCNTKCNMNKKKSRKIETFIMELRRIELVSENPSVKTSPITDYPLKFPSSAADSQAAESGSFIVLFLPQSLGKKGPHKVDAGYRDCEQSRADGPRLGSL